MTEKHNLFGVSEERVLKIHTFLDSVQKITLTTEAAEILISNRAQQWTTSECLIAGIHLGVDAGMIYAEQQLDRIIADLNRQKTERDTNDHTTAKPESPPTR